MFHADTEITIRQAAGVADGKTVYEEIPAAGRVIERSQRTHHEFGTVRDGAEVLLAPPVVPRLPARLAVGGREFEISAVRVCRDLVGNLVGCRCTLGGAAAEGGRR